MLFGFNAEEVFDMAIAIEENGKKFYEDAQKCVSDETVKKLFEELAAEEVKHKERFLELKKLIPDDVKGQGVYDPDNEGTLYLRMMADEHVFSRSDEINEKVCGIKSAEDALKLAIQFEKDTIVFFLTMQEHTETPKGKEMIGLLIKEEQQHVRRLALALRNLTKSS